MKIILFVAPPAAGKGTQSEMISKKYKIPHISVGAMLRKEVAEKTEIGKKIDKILKEGYLIDDKLTIKIVEKRTNKQDCNKGYILDGFPRSLNQVNLYEELLKKTNKKINYVFYLKIDKEIAYKRIEGRLTCNDCHLIYNINDENMKPLIENKCDHCGQPLVKRNDDSLETFETRLKTYLTLTKPLLNYYKNKGILYEIDSNDTKENIFNKIVTIIDGDAND